MEYHIGHMLMALSVIMLMTIFAYTFGHVTGVVAYQITSGAAATVAITHLVALIFK